MVPGSYNDHTAYCPMLGHQVPFSYCRNPGSSLPCSRISNCRRDVLSSGDFSSLLSRRPEPGAGRIGMILRALELAKSR